MTDRRKVSPVPFALELPAGESPSPATPLALLLPGGPARIAPEERDALDEFALAAERAAPPPPVSAEPAEWISPEGHLVRFLPAEDGSGRYAVLLTDAGAGDAAPDPARFRLHAAGRALPFDARGIAFLPGGSSDDG